MIVKEKITSFGFKTKKILVSRYEGKEMSKVQFLNWQPTEEQGFKYEFNNGTIETEEAMKSTELFIGKNLQRVFFQTQAFANEATFLSEVEFWLTINKMRKPDFAFFTKSQIKDGARDGKPIPAFVIEIISPNDKINKVESKVKEYFEVEVQVVWLIFPQLQEVRIYTSPKNIQILTDDDICTALPVMPDFQIGVNDLFKV
jgi:Uma2 family endonuclease